MRTTLDLDNHLLRSAKKDAASRGVTLTSVIEDALRAQLAPKPVDRGFRLNLNVVKGKRTPDVDVSDRSALYDAMEGRSADA